MLKNPNYYGLRHDTWRKYQDEAIEQISRTTKRVVVVEAPTGSGKSSINLGLLLVTGKRGFVLTPTKSLQEQYTKEARRTRLIMGKRNYPCILPKAPKGTKVDKAWCQLPNRKCTYENSCPYFVKRAIAQKAQVSIHNYHYYLHETAFYGADWVIADEGHDLQEIIAEFETIKLPRRLPALQELTAHNLKDLKRQAVDLLDFYAQYEPKSHLEELEIVRLCGQLDEVRKTARLYMFSENEKEVSLKPMIPTNPVDALLGVKNERGKRLLITSGTIIDPNMFAKVNQIDDFDYIKVPSVFKPEQKPIYYKPVADVTYKNREQSALLLAREIDELLESKPNVKGLIHPVSYDLAYGIYANLTHKERVLEYGRGANTLKAFRDSPEALWLISPAVSRGEDFPYDQARCQVVAKIPYPPLADPWVQFQVERAPYWYDYRTMQELWQTCGRVCRADDDFGETYILDKQYEVITKRRPNLVQEVVIKL